MSGSKRRGDGRDTKLTLCSWVESWICSWLESWICSLPGGCTLRYSWLPEWQWPILVRYSLPSERYSLPERQWPNPERYSSVCSCLRGCSWAGERYAAKGTAGGRGRVTPWKCLVLDTEKAIYNNDDITFLRIYLEGALPGGRGVWRRGRGRGPGRGRGRSSAQPWCGSLKRGGVKNKRIMTVICSQF